MYNLVSHARIGIDIVKLLRDGFELGTVIVEAFTPCVSFDDMQLTQNRNASFGSILDFSIKISRNLGIFDSKNIQRVSTTKVFINFVGS